MEITTLHLEEKMDWLFRHCVHVSEVEIKLMLPCDDHILEKLAWLVAATDETSIAYLSASEEQLITLFTKPILANKITASFSSFGSHGAALTRLIATHCNNLKHLKLREEDGQNYSLAFHKLFEGWSHLESLDIQEQSYVTRRLDLVHDISRCVNLKQFRSLYADDALILSLAQSCPLLEEVLLPSVWRHELTPASQLILAAHCSHLRVLDVSSLVVDDAAVVALCTGCPQLSTLFVNSASPLTYHGALTAMLTHGHKLQCIKVPLRMFAAELGSADLPATGYGFVPALPALRQVHVQGQVWDDVLSYAAAVGVCRVAANAQLIKLDAPGHIFHAMAHCGGMKLLTSLHCRDCRKVSDADILPAIAYLGQLQKLKLCMPYLLSDVVLSEVAQSCLQLQELTLSYAQQTTDAGWIAVLRSCPHLSRICVAMCSQLTDAFLEEICRSCANITHLEVNLCPLLTPAALVALVQKCSGLRQLAASSKDMTVEQYTQIKSLEALRRFIFVPS